MSFCYFFSITLSKHLPNRRLPPHLNPNPEKFISLLEYLAYPLVNYNMKKAILLLGEKDKGFQCKGILHQDLQRLERYVFFAVRFFIKVYELGFALVLFS